MGRFIIIMMIEVVYVSMIMFKVKVTWTLPRQDSGAHSPPERKTVRDGSGYHNGWIFGKITNGLRPPTPSFSENYFANIFLHSPV